MRPLLIRSLLLATLAGSLIAWTLGTAALADGTGPGPSTAPTPTPSPAPPPTPMPRPTHRPTVVPGNRPPSHIGGHAIHLPPPATLSGPPSGPSHAAVTAGGGSEDASITGGFSTELLDRRATVLRARGWSEAKITQAVYVPFIVEGPASWTNTWGAPRYAGGFHLHEGQDVFCQLGARVLATESGTIEFDTNTLGGNVAKLIRPDGSYWYYAHLSGWNRALKSGQQVTAGTVVGYCGNTGDAAGGPTHVHFGEYSADGVASDPMAALVGWLHAAEARQGALQLSPPPAIGGSAATVGGTDPLAVMETSGQASIRIGLPAVALLPSRPTAIERSALAGSAAIPFGLGAALLAARRRRRETASAC